MKRKSTYNTFRILTTICCLWTLYGCGVQQENEKLKVIKGNLQKQVDSLVIVIDSIQNTTAIKFEKGLQLKFTSQKDSAFKTFKTLYQSDSLPLWGRLIENEINNLSREVKESNLKNVFVPGDTLLLYQENSKCGEWGGDIYSIRLHFDQDYSKGFHEGEIMGQVKVERFNCDTLMRKPYSTKPALVQVKTVRLDEGDKELVKQSIHDLLEDKMTNPVFISHAGIVNRVQLISKSDTTLMIEDYPSNKWQRFHGLLNDLMKK